jgi:cobaltochelatase CobN
MWLREEWRAHAVLHNGKHGNLEWLPGKALALSCRCYPEAALGALPNVYPFIVNDPGEGSQAKRRTAAVIVDHLTPPLARAETYGPLKDLEALIDEYYLAAGLDPRRRDLLRQHVLDLMKSNGLDQDAGIAEGDETDAALKKVDTWICELKEAQIRDGLHILGQAPEGRLETDLLVALTRVPRGAAKGGDASLVRALAADMGLQDFDPLDCGMGDPWLGARPDTLASQAGDPWRTCGDTVERLELLAATLVSGNTPCAPAWTATTAVLDEVAQTVRPSLQQSATNEIGSCLKGLSGRFVEPGPSGAPTRGRLDVLPTGRNFYSVDNRALPTPAAWELGRKSAARLVERHLQDHGRWPKALGLTAWGTSNMRTGGDDIAQALALIGAKPVWDLSSWRVTGYEIAPLAKLGRPRIDVTLRISGFFRDAFPAQIELFDSAVRAVGALDEDSRDNPVAARMKEDAQAARAQGLSDGEAIHVSGLRVFGSKPGAYGAGLQALIDEKLWNARSDLAESYIGWGGYAYGKGVEGEARRETFTLRLRHIEAVVQNQDNREHDLLDSDDYYQFEGGMTAAVEHVSGARPTVYHNDHSRPERPVIRTLEEEIGRVVRSRVVNPKWIAGVMRHGYKGAFEIVATVDYMFAFAATTGAVKDHHFDLAYDAFLGDEAVRGFMEENNAPGLKEMAERFEEALSRGLWTPRSNSVHLELQKIAGEPETTLAGAAE